VVKGETMNELDAKLQEESSGEVLRQKLENSGISYIFYVNSEIN
jgi:hypothetical protein